MRILSAGVLLILLATTTGADDRATETAENSVMQLMVTTITPASDTLWGVDNPQSKEEWKVLDDAAVALIDAFEKTRLGGAGPNDAEWARQEKFQAYIDADIAAVKAARAAIAARDLDALFTANDALYTPCESCHVDFNPAVSGAGN